MSAQTLTQQPVSTGQGADELEAALEVARSLIAAGAPIFIARPAVDAAGNWDATGGTGGCGYDLPTKWQETTPDPRVIDQYRPGHALCLVQTITNALDTDTQSGGEPSRAGLVGASMWPQVIGVASTPSGGTHELIAPLQVGSKDRLLPGLDLKGGKPDGTGRGMIFIAPTVKLSKVTGLPVPYRWTVPPMLEELNPADDSGLAIAELVKESQRGSHDHPEPEAYQGAPFLELPEPGQTSVSRWMARTLEGVAFDLATSARWPANHTDERGRGWEKLQADCAYRLGRLARASWNSLTMDEARAIFIANAPTDARWTKADAAQKFQAQCDRGSPAALPASLQRAARDPGARVTTTLDTGELVDLATGEVLPPIDQDEETPDERIRRLFPRLDWHALWADDTEEEWIHYPLLPARRSVTIYSPPKAGKSLFLAEFAVTVSCGQEFLGHTPTRRYRVLYVDFENYPRGDVRSRLQAMGYAPDDLDHLDYLSFPSMAGFDTEMGAQELLAAVAAYGSEVVIIDTVSRAIDGEENSNDTWLQLYRRTGLKLKQAGISVIRLDHTGKDEAKGTRGGSAKSGDVDAVWRLTKITEHRLRLECTDSRMHLDTKTLVISRHSLPRLHHSLESVAAISNHEAKIIELIKLCDSNGIPTDANREEVRAFSKGRGLKVAQDVIQEAIKRRKAASEVNGIVPFTPHNGTAQNAERNTLFTPVQVDSK